MGDRVLVATIFVAESEGGKEEEEDGDADQLLLK